MNRQNSHIFHFVMDRGMKKNLKNLDIFKNSGSFSSGIVKILSFLIPLIKKEHKWGEQRLSRYLLVCEDTDVIREHIQVYCPGELYRQLKLIHQDLNVYSIAQLVREFLRFFLAWVDVYGDEVFDKLRKLFKQWKDEDNINRLTPRQIAKQLLIIIQHFLNKNSSINVYNQQFSPSWIFLL